MNTLNPLFRELIDHYIDTNIEHPQLKAVTTAQWLLESSRGSSNLSQIHYNFGGLKWRSEMQGYACKVQYMAHDGSDDYCRFCSLEDFIAGYWRFLQRPPYAGLPQHTDSEEEFIRFLGPIYAPADPGYADKVLSLVGEARDLLGEEIPVIEEPVINSINGVVVIDPGHGGTRKVGGSSANNATSASGVLEKTMNLDMALLVRTALTDIVANDPDLNLEIHLTRDRDANSGLSTRANVARDRRADVFLSIHFNGFNGSARGVETFVLPVQSGNVNIEDDRALAGRIQQRVYEAIKRHDPKTRDRKVKQQSLGVLRDVHLGNTETHHRCRAALLEIEFIDVPAVDELFNVGADAVRHDVAEAIALAIVDDVAFHA